MSDPKFHLRDPKSTTPTAIFMKASINGKTFKYGIGKSIFPELWDLGTQRPITVKSVLRPFEKYDPHIESTIKNVIARIINVSNEFNKIINNLEINDQEIEFREIRKRLDQKYKRVKVSPDKLPSLTEFIDQFVKGIKKGDILISFGPNRGQRYTLGTIKNYEGFKEQFKLFQKSKFRKYDFEDINIHFYDQFVEYFTNKEYSLNTIGRHIKNLKVIMRMAKERGLHQNTEFERKSFETLKTKVTSIYLSKKEIEAIYKLNLTNKPHFDKVRDVFLVGCYTGLRYSDYSRVKPEHIKNNRLEIITQKTSEKVIIPIHPRLKAILNKYNFKLPRTHEQKVNKHIKDIADLAGITETVEVEKVKGGKKLVVNIPKHKLVKTHTARRSAATNMYLAGIPSIDIMKITGHTTERNFLKYINVTKEQTAERLALHPYFTTNLKVRK